MSNAYIGEIRLLPYSYAPRGWAYCNGQDVPISQYSAAFSIIGITYGGDGRVNFKLPNLKGRVPVGFGRGPGLSDYPQGQMYGFPGIQLTESNLPKHIHTMKVSDVLADETTIDNLDVPAQLVTEKRGRKIAQPGYSTTTPTQAMHAGSLASMGGDAQHENRQPYIVIPFCICLDGIFPTRS